MDEALDNTIADLLSQSSLLGYVHVSTDGQDLTAPVASAMRDCAVWRSFGPIRQHHVGLVYTGIEIICDRNLKSTSVLDRASGRTEGDATHRIGR